MLGVGDFLSRFHLLLLARAKTGIHSAPKRRRGKDFVQKVFGT